jgi:glycosyltransferase involved in cell wall biosynthesis
LGVEVDVVTPEFHFPIFTVERILFNERLRSSAFAGDATIGFDLDGYRLGGGSKIPHIAAIKGVLEDAVPFEHGFTRLSMAFQAKLEKSHARRADRVITISRYCAERLEDLYGVRDAIVVPELIDLEAWRKLSDENPAPGDDGRFTVLCVCRFYPRKRVDVLLRAAALLAEQIPELAIRIVGGGPEAAGLRSLCNKLHLGSVVKWVGDATADALASEYNRADVFCLPSVQEGFGIVFLEAMAAGKPIVAARAAAMPEVVPQGILVNPDDPVALADGIARLYSDRDLRERLSARGKEEVQQYEMTRVARQFLDAAT